MKLIDIINREVEIAIQLAETTYGITNAREILPLNVSMNNRMSRALGWVRLFTRRTDGVKRFVRCDMQFSGRWLCESPQLIDTIRHEVAHYIDTVINNRRSNHDSTWKSIAVALGATPKLSCPTPPADVYRRDVVPDNIPFYCAKCAEKFMLTPTQAQKSFKHNSCGAFLVSEINVRGIARKSVGYVGTMPPAFAALVESFKPVEPVIEPVETKKAAANVDQPKKVKLGKRNIELGCSCGYVGVYSARVKLTSNLVCCPKCLQTGNMKPN